MPIRQHLELLASIDFFQLNPEEQQALIDFNLAFELSIQQLVTNTQKNITRLNPLFRTSVDPQNNTAAKIRSKILQNNLNELKLDLPLSIKALGEKSPYSLIKLAFHADGGFFHQYLNDILNAEIKKRLDPQKTFASFEALYHYNNILTNDDFLAQITEPATSHPFYPAIEKVFVSRGWQPTTLLCCDGSALDRLAAAFMYSHLIKSRSIDATKPELPLEDKAQKILNCAAIHGSYSATCTLIQRLCHTIKHSTSLIESDNDYEKFRTELFEPYLRSRYKTVAYLLLIELQQLLFTKNRDPHSENFDSVTIHYRQLQQLIAIYRNLNLAKKDERSCRNILRLAFGRDAVAARLQQLFPIPGVQFSEINEAMQLLKNQFPDLQADFEQIDRHKSHEFTEHQDSVITPSPTPDVSALPTAMQCLR